MRRILLIIFTAGLAVIAHSQDTEYDTKLNIHYYSESITLIGSIHSGTMCFGYLLSDKC